MIEIFKSVDNGIVRTEEFSDGVWINLVNPTEEEINNVSSSLNVELDYLKAALDDEERARIESDNGQTLVIVDTPIVDKEGDMNMFTTIPLAIVLIRHMIITVCLKGETLLKDFSSNKVKAFFTHYKTRFILQILYRNATRFLQHLKHIDRTSNRIEQDLHKSQRNKSSFS